MQKPIEIINEGRIGQPVGRLKDPDGNTVLVWSLSGPDLAAAMQAAVGAVPQPPTLGAGGVLVPIESVVGSGVWAVTLVTSYVYNPSGDEANKALVQIYQQRLAAWNDHARNVHEALLLLIKDNISPAHT